IARQEKIHGDVIVYMAQHGLGGSAKGIAIFLGEVDLEMQMRGQQVDHGQHHDEPQRSPYRPPLSADTRLATALDLFAQVAAGQPKEEEDHATYIKDIAHIHHSPADAAIVEV